MKAPVIIAFVHLVTKGKSQVKKKKDFWAIIYSFKELKEMNSYPSNLIKPKTSPIVPNIKDAKDYQVLLWKSQALKTSQMVHISVSNHSACAGG